MIYTEEAGPIKRDRDDFNEDIVSKELKRIRISSQPDSDLAENEDDYCDNKDRIFRRQPTAVRRSGLDPLYFLPRQKGVRHVDFLEDELVRKSRRHSWEQQSVSSSVTPSEFALIFPSSVGPHPTTDMRYLSHSSRSTGQGTEVHEGFSHRQEAPRHTSSHTSSSVTHSDWFAMSCGGGSDSVELYDTGYNSDDCEDMVVAER